MDRVQSQQRRTTSSWSSPNERVTGLLVRLLIRRLQERAGLNRYDDFNVLRLKAMKSEKESHSLADSASGSRSDHAARPFVEPTEVPQSWPPRRSQNRETEDHDCL